MRGLLTNGIKAILMIAVLSVAAHWAMRGGSDERKPAGMAAIPDPITTGSITPRKIERAVERPVAASEPAPAAKGLDQDHLLKLIADASSQKPVAKSAKR